MFNGEHASLGQFNELFHNLKCVHGEAKGEAMVQEWSSGGGDSGGSGHVSSEKLKAAHLSCGFEMPVHPRFGVVTWLLYEAWWRQEVLFLKTSADTLEMKPGFPTVRGVNRVPTPFGPSGIW